MGPGYRRLFLSLQEEFAQIGVPIYISFLFLVGRFIWTENARSGGERGTASRKQGSGANPALKGKPAQVSTVRTEKLVFSLNYERLGNRANVAGTGTSLCRLIGEWKIDRGLRPDGNEQHRYRSEVWKLSEDCVRQ
jgi:hypothetical protein